MPLCCLFGGVEGERGLVDLPWKGLAWREETSWGEYALTPGASGALWAGWLLQVRTEGLLEIPAKS